MNKKPSQKLKQSPKFQLRKQIYTSLNLEYKSFAFTNEHTFQQLISICQKQLRQKIHSCIYELPLSEIYKYKMEINSCEIDPFVQEQRLFLLQLANVCEKVIVEPGYGNIQKINNFIKDNKLGCLKLNQFYRRFQLNFRYVNLKQAMVYTCLSQCNVWYTIIKNRRKSQKQFDLDPLIKYFQQFVARLKLQNPYHIDILPKKQVKNIQKKVNKQKNTNQLFQAVSNGDHELVKQLLLKGAKIQLPAFLNNRQRNQVKCAHKACLSGDLRMCKLLDSFGANWQAQDSQLMTPIFYAIQSGNMDVIRYLVQDIKVNIEKQEIQKRTPFYWACTQGDIHIIDYFYKAGCNVNYKSQLGRTALSKSCYLGRRDIVLYLLKCKEIDMFSQCKKGRTALHNAVFGPKGGRQGHKFGTNQKDSPQCAQILLENGMNVDVLDFQDCTSLHVAMSSDAIQSIRLLLAYGASLTIKNNYGQTPLMTGAKFGHVQACKILHQQFHDNILCKDIFNKNLLLLTAKFQQNSQDGTINPVYLYFLQPFIKQCLKQNQIQQLNRTFLQIVSSQFANKMVIQLTTLWNGFKKYNVPIPELGIKQIQRILQISMNCSTNSAKPQKNINIQQHTQLEQQNRMFVQFTKQLLKQIHLSKQKLEEIHLWLIKRNQPKILQFIHQHGLLSLEKLEITAKEFFSVIQNQQLSLKEKVVSFCILSLNFDWVGYRSQEKSNILHLLVRKQRSSCILQIFKALSNKIPPKILTNRYLHQQSNHHKILQQLLWQKDQSGLDPHQLSLILKNKSIAKLIQQKLKEQHFQYSSVLDIKEYEAVLEDDGKLLEVFNNLLHDRQEELCGFQEGVGKMDREGVEEWWGFRRDVEGVLEVVKSEINNGQNTQYNQNIFWKHPQIQTRKLTYIKSSTELPHLKTLHSQKAIGIDLQYFTQQGITLISTLQLSSILQDFIIDCLTINIRQISQYIQPIFHDHRILKIMHGADNDLVLIRSLFGLCLVNFVDTSRLDIDLRENKNDLRGLATLVREYMGVVMNKEYQVSEWRIRPIPKAMLQYARKDSMILPYLLVQMLSRIHSDYERIKQFILSGCKQSRRNKKANQPLIRQIRQAKNI